MPLTGDFDAKLTATYRLQFHKGFTFADAARQARYFRDLGVSHIYSSPIMKATPGSNHGYDVVDFDEINPELGGREGFEALAASLRAEGLGIVLDIVPNHMCVGGSLNPYWLDLLEKGPDSVYADFFDVDFAAPHMNGKVLAPFLGDSYDKALARGEIKLKPRENGRIAVFYAEHCFPLREIDEQSIHDIGGPALPHDRLHQLLEAQHYRLASWRTANDLVNFRRFFEITTLAGVKIERASAFDAIHKVPLDLFARGLIDGVRVDHVDGLTDPAAYCARLREALKARSGERPQGRSRAPYIVVEKILASHEPLPDWPVHGSTGYDFMNEISSVQHDPAGAPALNAYWREVSGRTTRFDEEETQARRELLDRNLNGQTESVVGLVLRCAAFLGPDRDLPRAAIRRAVVDVISRLRVYRSYAIGGPENPGAGPDLEAAFEAALAEPTPETQAIDLMRRVFASRSPEPAFAEAIRRFNQLAAPAAAKAVEDTAFYRYGRLLSRNDVGFDAGTLGITLEDFHARMGARAEFEPHAMLTTATHDHKRGEDARARLAVLSEIPELWNERRRAWRERLGRATHPADQDMLLQSLVGAWPLDLAADDTAGLSALAERLIEWRRKALREGKLRTSWLHPSEVYEGAAEREVGDLLDPGRNGDLLRDVSAFVDEIAAAGVANALTQTGLRCLAPGVPDLYRGGEFWDFTLVDPDNRRPVDFAARAKRLGQKSKPAGTFDEGVKQALIHALLSARAELPELFAFGDYTPIPVHAPPGASVFAFARKHEDRTLVAAVALRLGRTLRGSRTATPAAEFWGEARLESPLANGRAVWGEAELRAQTPLARVFAGSPVAVWVSE